MACKILYSISCMAINCLLLICTYKTHGARILLLQGPGEGSHYLTATSIGEAMVKRGHQVTVLLSDLYAYRANNSKDSSLFNFEIYRSSMTAEMRDEMYEGMNRAAFKGQFLRHVLVNMSRFNELAYDECENILTDVELLRRLNGANFDLILVDMIFNCPVVIAQYLERPFIYLVASSVIPHAFSFRYRLPVNPAYMPEMLTGFDHKMTFMTRLKNTLSTCMAMMMTKAALTPYEQLKVIYNIQPEVSMYDSIAEAELWFLQTNFALDFPRPLMPNVIPIGGLTTKPAKPLDDELDNFMESSGEPGVILFSMGTYVTSMEEEKASMFAKAFAGLPQKVIWRLGGSRPPHLSNNVRMMKWIPQNDILGHQKIRAFVMHCGINGVYEALYHAVPLVCLPLFGDQFDIAARVSSKGIGVQLAVSTLESSVLTANLRMVISDQRFKSNIKKYSKIFRDAPRLPAEQAADWMDYVLRHGDTQHLRSASLDLYAFQYLLLDVILTIVAICIILVITTTFLYKLLCRKCFGTCVKHKSKTD